MTVEVGVGGAGAVGGRGGTERVASEAGAGVVAEGDKGAFSAGVDKGE